MGLISFCENVKRIGQSKHMFPPLEIPLRTIPDIKGKCAQ